MSSSNTSTFDDNPPRRPGLSELGGGAKENSARFPPDPVKHPTAEDFNQGSRQLEAQGRVGCLARLFVTFSAGTPSIAAVQALGANVVAGSFTVTDESTGSTLIKWKTGTGAPAGALPPVTGAMVSQTDDIEIDRLRAILTTSSGDPAVRVKSKLITVATDCNFCVELY